jgi:hypothetical protein
LNAFEIQARLSVNSYWYNYIWSYSKSERVSISIDNQEIRNARLYLRCYKILLNNPFHYGATGWSKYRFGGPYETLYRSMRQLMYSDGPIFFISLMSIFINVVKNIFWEPYHVIYNH